MMLSVSEDQLPEQSMFFEDTIFSFTTVKVNHLINTHTAVGEVSWFSGLYGVDVCECFHKLCR